MVGHHAVTTTRSSGGLVGRVVLTLAGAAGLVIGAFLNWWHTTAGTSLTNKSFYQETFGAEGSFIRTAGFVTIVLGLAAVVGLAGGSGWLTRLAGALGIAAVVLYGIQVYRADTSLTAVSVGAWLALAGGVIALIGGFLGRPVLVSTPAETVDVD
ncbi:MAG: hypothetical protein V7637_6041 [Mycobacteriales bacterium]|jgi:hypothetical protein